MPDNWSHGHYRPRFGLYKFCIWCVQQFITTREDAKFCSPRCRQAFKLDFDKRNREKGPCET